MEELGCAPGEIRQLLEQAEPVNPCGQLYSLLAPLCEALEDYTAAMGYYRKWHRLDPEDADCCMGLARNYAMGRGVRQDFEIALRYYQKAANQGEAEALHMVGVCYYEGMGARRNYKRALDFFQRAYAMGHCRSAYFLGLIHLRGLAGRPDKEKGMQYLQACAEEGDEESIAALAALNAEEQGA
jgi:tetratricopeptide (TPR) repeat protein